MNDFKILYLLAVTVTILMVLSCSSKEKENFSETKWAKRVEQTVQKDLYAAHYDDGKYFSPWMRMKDKRFIDVLGWKLFSKTNYTQQEKAVLPEILPDTYNRVLQTQSDFILWVGHNTFLLRIDNVYWMTDPIFSKRALLPARLTPPALTLKEFNSLVPAVNVIISHNHYDHLDRNSIKALPQNSNIYVPKGLKQIVLDMKKTTVFEMDWWEEINISNSTRLICLPAQHWSMRITQGRNSSLWASYLLITPDVQIYFGGDSGYFKGFKEIGKKYPGIDYAFMATTAYHPRWFMHYQHMNIAESVKGFEDLNARYFIPTQWGTFHLGSEPAGFPGLDLQRYIKKNHLDMSRFKIMDIGQIIPIL